MKDDLGLNAHTLREDLIPRIYRVHQNVLPSLPLQFSYAQFIHVKRRKKMSSQGFTRFHVKFQTLFNRAPTKP